MAIGNIDANHSENVLSNNINPIFQAEVGKKHKNDRFRSWAKPDERHEGES